MAEPDNAADQAANGPFSLDYVLREEAKAIHGEARFAETEAKARSLGPADASAPQAARQNLYRTLHELNSTALCLSGGGIRSASFALGVIQALAARCTPTKDGAQVSAQDSFLAQIHYLSTVSGGGYIGSWLSAWVARAGFPAVWADLVCRPKGSDVEPSTLSWLRAYSNYLTPKLGLASADTWAGAALFLRNMILNWMVIIPAVLLVILALKLIAVGGFTWSIWMTGSLRDHRLAYGVAVVIAIVPLIWALRFALISRPSCQPDLNATEAPREGPLATSCGATAGNTADIAIGVTTGIFLARDLLPALLSAMTLSIIVASDFVHDLRVDGIISGQWSLGAVAGAGTLFGVAVYALAWAATLLKSKSATPPNPDAWREMGGWLVAGAIYGAALGLGTFFYYSEYFDDIRIFAESSDALILMSFGVPYIILAQLTAEMVFVGLTSWKPRSEEDREWYARSTGYFAVAGLGWAIIFSLVLLGPEIINWFYGLDLFGGSLSDTTKAAATVLGPLAGIVSALLGGSRASPGTAEPKPDKINWFNVILAITVPLFLASLFAGLSYTLDALLLDNLLSASPLMLYASQEAADIKAFDRLTDLASLVCAGIAVIGLGCLTSLTVNVNRFSLHALYRNRIVRAFLGASHTPRRYDRFTGFDEGDNPRMRTLWPTKTPGEWRPFHVINMALNLVSSNNLAWQERKAASFTVSPLHAGTAIDQEGFRRSECYGSSDGGISVGTAVAISGAAASPNMGYHSSPLVTMVLALFNVRLGWWLGNPNACGNADVGKEGPDLAIKPFLQEMFGQTTNDKAFVYLSDGGHFENLGLYEMVRRRCQYIVVSDAGCDPDFKFEDLGNAVRKISIDLGVPVEFRDLGQLKSRTEEDRQNRREKQPPRDRVAEGHHLCAIGAVDYGDGMIGKILYVKAAFHKDLIANAGVRTYAIANPDFPHQSTGDQFFSESQFESYRALGYELMKNILEDRTEAARASAHPTLKSVIDDLHLEAKNRPQR